MRPGVVWFGEQLSRNELERVENFLDGGACDVVIVAGTTATFGYIIDWALRGSRDGAELIEVNPEETPLSRFATRLVREPAAIALPRIVDELLASRSMQVVGARPCRSPDLMARCKRPAGRAATINDEPQTTDPAQIAFGGSRNGYFCVCKNVRLPPAAINLLE